MCWDLSTVWLSRALAFSWKKEKKPTELQRCEAANPGERLTRVKKWVDVGVITRCWGTLRGLVLGTFRAGFC